MLQRFDTQVLPNADLLRVLAGEPAVQLYQAHQSLGALFGGSMAEAAARRYPGTYRRLAAAQELVRRQLREQLCRSHVFESPAVVRDYLRATLGRLMHEEFRVLYLDVQHQLIADETLFRGTLRQVSVYPREIVKRALQHSAAAILVAHNHPSGRTDASPADRALTKALRAAAQLLDVQVLDHFIVTAQEIASAAEQGWLESKGE